MSTRGWTITAWTVCLCGCGDGTQLAAPGTCTTTGERRCDGDDVQVCGDDGMWTVEERCATRCDLGGCTAPACAPGAARCDGPDVEQCNPRGTGWEFRQACDTSCVDGACVPAVCSPWSRRCSGLDVEECDERGLTWRRVETCDVACEGNACTTSSPCVAGTRRCNSRVVEACFGGAWQFEELCGATTCIDGACAACIPSDLRCSGLDVQRCSASGTGWERLRTCDTACLGGTCTECVPGDRRCSGSIVEICAADGSAYVPASYCATRCTAGACAPPECAPGAVRCDAGTVQVCDSGGMWVTTETCEYACVAGRCTVCSPGTLRCTGAAVEACASDGASWSFVRHCATGCTDGACNPYVCTPLERRCDGLSAQICDPTGTGWTTTETCSFGCDTGRCTECAAGTLRCSGNAVEACASDGSIWSFVQYCATGCTAGACNPLTCAPLSRRCSGRTVEVCNPTGTSWTALETCASACRDGICTGSTGGVCVPGTYRCVATDLEACDSIGGGWFYIQTCLTGCSAGACVGSACMPFGVTAAPASARADGDASASVYSAPIVDVAGTPIPDGTPVTVEATGGTLLAADGDTDTTAIDVLAFRGKVDAAVRAPSTAVNARVTFTVRGASRCTGQATVDFVSGTVDPRSVGLDFTTTSSRDGATTTAFWDTALGRLTAGTTTFGFGEDGDLVVTSSYNLNTSVRPGRTYADAPQFRVAFIEASSVTLDRLPNGLSPADDVLLINLQGSAASNTSAGNYEVLTVLRTEGLRVFFVSPIRGTYGVGGNSDLTGQKVMLQRVPRYRSVSIDGTLGASSWNASTGGVLFFKASGAVSVNLGGRIAMDAAGYRGGSCCDPTQGESYRGPGATNDTAPNGGGGGASYYGCICSGAYGAGAGHGAAGSSNAAGCGGGGRAGTAYGDANLTKWYLGSGGGATSWASCWGYYGLGGGGGGTIVIFAPTITNAGAISANGGNSTSPWGWLSGGGSGGSIYLLGNTVTLGATLVASTGGNTGAAYAGAVGRIRVDGATVTGTTTPAFTAGPAPTPVVATARTIAIDAAPGTVRGATIVAVEAYLPGTSRLRYFLTNDGAANWYEVNAGTAYTFPAAGSDLRFRVDWEAVGPSGVPSLSAVALQYDAD